MAGRTGKSPWVKSLGTMSFYKRRTGIWRAISRIRAGTPARAGSVVKCPWEPGERLWVREPWKISLFLPWEALVEYLSDGARKVCEPGGESQPPGWIVRKEQCLEDCRKAGVKPWLDRSVLRRRQTMFLPRCASRILLEITDIEVRNHNPLLKKKPWRKELKAFLR